MKKWVLIKYCSFISIHSLRVVIGVSRTLSEAFLNVSAVIEDSVIEDSVIEDSFCGIIFISVDGANFRPTLVLSFSRNCTAQRPTQTLWLYIVICHAQHLWPGFLASRWERVNCTKLWNFVAIYFLIFMWTLQYIYIYIYIYHWWKVVNQL